ncbi:hypothetical protein EOM39_07545 [Candidatus Gracilibacteria bacterium]|nr:hypothetical protein [Candidatus Gracilibacteria bacterium]
MRNIDLWKEEKGKQENENKVILFLSGIFYKSFDRDARFLSAKFGFKIKQIGGYETVGFPKNVLEKYLTELKQNNYGYLVFENNNGKLEIVEDFIGGNILNFQEENLIFFENNNKLEKDNLKSFLKDLDFLIKKYI